MSDTSKCKGCGAPVVWRYTPAGKLMPLNAETLAQPNQGSYVVVDDKECRPAEPMFDQPGTAYHMAHWATCPNAEDFKQ